MHSLSITISSMVLALTGMLDLEPPLSVQTLLLALLVGVIGVPHGALDHWTARELMEKRLPGLWLPTFLVIYLAVATTVVVGWFLMPLSTIIIFFVLSAWHFGLEERDHQQVADMRPHRSVGGLGPVGPYLGALIAVARGGMVIWLPTVFRRAEVDALLSQIIPGSLASVAMKATEITAYAAWLLAPIVVLECIFQFRAQPAMVLRTIAFAILFVSVGPLISFGVYFCLWHSVRGLKELREKVGGEFFPFVVKLLPLTILSLLMAVVLWWSFDRTETLSPVLLRTLFIGLSAIAIPHLMLNVIAELAKRRGSVPDVGQIVEARQ